MVEKVIVCFVCIPVASNTQTDLPCEPWFGSGGGAEIFVHLEKEAFTDFQFQHRMLLNVCTFPLVQCFSLCQLNIFDQSQIICMSNTEKPPGFPLCGFSRVQPKDII